MNRKISKFDPTIHESLSLYARQRAHSRMASMPFVRCDFIAVGILGKP